MKLNGAACAMSFAGIFLCGALAFGASAPAYPHKPIRIILQFPPGGPSDVQARLIAPKLTEAWGEPVVIDNRPGGNGIIGQELIAHAEPDGYTLIIVSAGFAVLPSLYPKLPFDTLRDFVAIAPLTAGPGIVVVNPALPVKSIPELLAYARNHPGKISFGSAGSGAPSHLAVELLKMMTQVEMVHIPYKGMTPAMTDLMGGQIQLSIPTIAAGLPLARTGKLRALAVTGAQRSVAAPELPTVAEAGVPGYQASNWYGLMGPAKLPHAIVVQLNHEIGRILALPDVRDKLVNIGMEPQAATPEQFSAYVKSEIEKWAKVVARSGAKAD